MFDDLLAHYRAHPDEARKLIAVGESPADPALDAPTLAAWTMTANQLMNLDEVLDQMNIDLFRDYIRSESRRQFLGRGVNAVGWAARRHCWRANVTSWRAADVSPPVVNERQGDSTGGLTSAARQHFPAKAKQVIYLHMVGGPPQMDLYDYKPRMRECYNVDLPETIRKGQRLTTMTSGQARFPVAPSKYRFDRHGKCGMWVTELMPYTARMVDDICFIRTMHTEAINHEPAICYMQTGNQITGRPCLGSWVSYGLGSLNENLPTFVVLVARPTNTEQLQAISARLWHSGYLPGEHAGVTFRNCRRPDPVHQQSAGRVPKASAAGRWTACASSTR